MFIKSTKTLSPFQSAIPPRFITINLESGLTAFTLSDTELNKNTNTKNNEKELFGIFPPNNPSTLIVPQKDYLYLMRILSFKSLLK